MFRSAFLVPHPSLIVGPSSVDPIRGRITLQPQGALGSFALHHLHVNLKPFHNDAIICGVFLVLEDSILVVGLNSHGTCSTR